MKREDHTAVSAPLFRVAWLALLLGLGMEAVLLRIATGFGGFFDPRSLVADLVKNVSWSVFVCVGLAVGKLFSEIRTPTMGLLGLLAAPLAFEVSRVLHNGTTQALAVTAEADPAVSPVLLALLKGIEYGCLGLVIGWVGGRPWGGVAAGLAVGAVFGGSSPEPLPAADVLSRGVNEVLFPVGCALVLFTAATLGEKSKSKGSP